ncbi:MAG: alpha/beta hydrolase [Chloroflexota bacterium]
MIHETLEKHFIYVGKVQLHVVTAGPEDGEPVFLLHGFPEFWYGWRNQIAFLAEQGYRVIVPDQRGYNLSDKPKGASNYTLDILANDVTNLADHFGYETFNLVGHDWGALVAWWVATVSPERLRKLVILNVPYPTVAIEQFNSGNLSQFLKSWYIGFFQVPFVPETLISLGDYEPFARGMQQNANKGSFTDEDMVEYRRAWSQPGAMTAMINWYRALTISVNNGLARRARHIPTPTLMLWGENDVALGRELALPSIQKCDDGELVYYPNATHWIQHDEAEDVNQEILIFLQAPLEDTETDETPEPAEA